MRAEKAALVKLSHAASSMCLDKDNIEANDISGVGVPKYVRYANGSVKNMARYSGTR